MIPIDLSNKVAGNHGCFRSVGARDGKGRWRKQVRISQSATTETKKTAHLLQDEITAKGVQAVTVAGRLLQESGCDKRYARLCLGELGCSGTSSLIMLSFSTIGPRFLQQPAEDYESQFQSCVLHNVYMGAGRLFPR